MAKVKAETPEPTPKGKVKVRTLCYMVNDTHTISPRTILELSHEGAMQMISSGKAEALKPSDLSEKK